MSEPINYEAVLVDIEDKIAKLQATAEGIRSIMAMGGTAPTGGGPGGKVTHDAFLKMSIPDATKKYLTMTRQKKDTQSIIEALEQGGLPRSEYSTVYAVLRRREKQVGDIINMKGDWALSEWYPNYRKLKADDTPPDPNEEPLSPEAQKEVNKAIEQLKADAEKTIKSAKSA
jgi:hypothetical protein